MNPIHHPSRQPCYYLLKRLAYSLDHAYETAYYPQDIGHPWQQAQRPHPDHQLSVTSSVSDASSPYMNDTRHNAASPSHYTQVQMSLHHSQTVHPNSEQDERTQRDDHPPKYNQPTRLQYPCSDSSLKLILN